MAEERALTCPVCKTQLPTSALECSTCGLPRELWPDPSKKGSGEADLDELFGGLLKDLDGLDSSGPGGASRDERATPAATATTGHEGASPPTPPGAAAPAGPRQEQAPPPKGAPGSGEREEKVEIQPVQVAPLPGAEGLALQALMDEVSGQIQIGKRAGFDVSPFGPTAARAVGLMRAGSTDEARTMLLDLRTRLHDSLASRFSARVESIEMRLQRLRTFLHVEPALHHLEKTREALKRGDFGKAQQELRRLEGETTRLDEELGTLGQTLDQVDLLTQEVERLGGDATQALLLQGKAFDAARAGDRRKAEGLLTTASAMLLDALAPLIGQELVRRSEQVKAQRARGRDIRISVALIRAITMELKTRNYSRAVATLNRLRDEIEAGESTPLPPKAASGT